jgi:hypothetical protein
LKYEGQSNSGFPRRPLSAPALLLWVAVASLAGCGPASESEKAYFQARAAEREREQALQEALSAGAEAEGALAMVQGTPAPDGGGDTGGWVVRRMKAEDGAAMFARWSTLRQGAARFEVQYTYSLVDRDNRMFRKGFSWDVDVGLKVVGQPRAIDPAEVGVNRLAPESKRMRRIREAEASLE